MVLATMCVKTCDISARAVIFNKAKDLVTFLNYHESFLTKKTVKIKISTFMKCETILSTNQLNQVHACTQVHISSLNQYMHYKINLDK